MKKGLSLQKLGTIQRFILCATRMAQDTGKFRQNTKDQYYTKTAVAKACVDKIVELVPSALTCRWVEPSAGNGVFLKCLPLGTNMVGIDIDPKDATVLRADFLGWLPVPVLGKKNIVFGNPPFGRQGSSAKAFIAHASLFADYIAFILPRSFVKPSMSRAFPRKFHCIWSRDLEANAFEVNGAEYDVPCVFQIWERRSVERALPVAVDPVGFTYVKSGEPYHLAFRRVGGHAGKVYDTSVACCAQAHYFWRLDEQFLGHQTLEQIKAEMNAHVFPTNTVGPRSLSKTEANEVMNAVLANIVV
jgi:hypothetical protein